MGKAEDFGKVIKVVTELMDVTEEEITGRSRVTDIVDARWLTIVLMRELGYPTRQISELMSHPERTVNHALSCFDERVRYVTPSLGNILAIARQQVLK